MKPPQNKLMISMELLAVHSKKIPFPPAQINKEILIPESTLILTLVYKWGS